MLEHERRDAYLRHARKYGGECVAETAALILPKREYEQLELELATIGLQGKRRRRRRR
jgi:hypothetical protein